MKPNKNFWMFLCILAATGGSAWISHEILLQRLFFGLCCFLIVCFVTVRFSLQGVAVKRYPFHRIRQVGTVFRERVEIFNYSSFPKLWIELEDHSGLPGTRSSRVITFLPPKSQRVFTSMFVLVKRGFFHLGPIKISSCDPLGLFTSEKTIKAENSIVIYPYKIKISRFYNPSGQFSGGKAVQSNSRDQTPHFSSIRDYKQGDSLTRIHWRSTAKYGKLISKEFDQDPKSTVWIFLDGNKGNHFESNSELKIPEIDRHGNRTKVYDFSLPEDSFEYCVSIAASIADYYLQQGQSVGFFINDEICQFLSPERGQRQLGKIMESLALASCTGELPIQAVIESQLSAIQNHSTVVIITADDSPGTTSAYESLVRRGANALVVLVDGDSFARQKTKDVDEKVTSTLRHVIIRNHDNLLQVLEMKEAALK